nr:MAG TPA: hypothetical protein [Bacteriophage sp.]DAP33028.1 MAG TPA: hypothetical protein [Caudoviricetes sp.]DAT92639.1 MAG TPA: hypothetical protein [Caudoviricetes sp.]
MVSVPRTLTSSIAAISLKSQDGSSLDFSNLSRYFLSAGVSVPLSSFDFNVS